MLYLSNSKIFLYCLLNFILGIGVSSFLPFSYLEKDIMFFFGFVFFLVLFLLEWEKNRSSNSLDSSNNTNPKGLVFLFLTFLFLGFWRYSISIPVNSPNKIFYYNEQELKITGVLKSEPDRRENNQKLEVEVEDVFLERGYARKVGGKVLVTTDSYPLYNYGDYLEINCKLESPESFEDFAYDRYLAKSGIYSVCYWPEIKVLKNNQGNWFYFNIFKFKNKLSTIINYGLSEPESTLARAIILGEKKNISDDIRDKFSRVGLSHIVAISGLHISILSGMLIIFFIYLGLWRRQASFLASFFIFLYVILVGAPVSAIRAGLMGFLVLLAFNLGRLNRAINSIVLSASLLLLANPRFLRDDIGFQLSFLAVIGLVYFYPVIEKNFKKYRFPGFFGVRKILSVTLAAQLLTWPILMVNFNQISLIAPVANILVVWILPFLMISLIFGLFLGSILPGLSFLFFLPSNLIIIYVIKVVDFLASFSYFSLNF